MTANPKEFCIGVKHKSINQEPRGIKPFGEIKKYLYENLY